MDVPELVMAIQGDPVHEVGVLGDAGEQVLRDGLFHK